MGLLEELVLGALTALRLIVVPGLVALNVWAGVRYAWGQGLGASLLWSRRTPVKVLLGLYYGVVALALASARSAGGVETLLPLLVVLLVPVVVIKAVFFGKALMLNWVHRHLGKPGLLLFCVGALIAGGLSASAWWVADGRSRDPLAVFTALSNVVFVFGLSWYYLIVALAVLHELLSTVGAVLIGVLGPAAILAYLGTSVVTMFGGNPGLQRVAQVSAWVGAGVVGLGFLLALSETARQRVEALWVAETDDPGAWNAPRVTRREAAAPRPR